MTTLTKGKMQGALRTHSLEEGLNLPTISKTVMHLHEMGMISEGKDRREKDPAFLTGTREILRLLEYPEEHCGRHGRLTFRSRAVVPQ